MSKAVKMNKIKLLLEIYVTFLKLGTFGFGGGYSLIPLIEREVVENKKWIDKERLIDTFAVAECLPGAIALNASGFVGYSIAGILGAFAAMLGNLTSPIVIVLSLTIMFEKLSTYDIVQNAFNGIRPAIIGLISYAGYKIGKTSLRDRICIIISISAFIGVLFLHLHPIMLIFLGAVVGVGMSNIKERRFRKKLESIEEEAI